MKKPNQRISLFLIGLVMIILLISVFLIEIKHSKRLNADPIKVSSLCFSPAGNLLSSGGTQGIIKLWDLKTSKEWKSIHGHSHMIESLSFSSDGRILASSSLKSFSTTEVKLWDINTGRELFTIYNNDSTECQIGFSPISSNLLAMASQKEVKLLDILEKRATILYSKPGCNFDTVAFSPDGKLIAFGGISAIDSEVLVWNVNRKEIETRLAGSELNMGPIFSLSFCSNCKWLALGGCGIIKLWDIELNREIATLSGHEGDVQAVVFHPHDNLLVSCCSSDKTVKIWNIVSKEELETVRCDTSGRPIAFSNDGSILAIGTWRSLHLFQHYAEIKLIDIQSLSLPNSSAR